VGLTVEVRLEGEAVRAFLAERAEKLTLHLLPSAGANLCIAFSLGLVIPSLHNSFPQRSLLDLLQVGEPFALLSGFLTLLLGFLLLPLLLPLVLPHGVILPIPLFLLIGLLLGLDFLEMLEIATIPSLGELGILGA